jgi:group I intron endonuclease
MKKIVNLFKYKMVKENTLIDKSEIYMVINQITGKKYIGQVQCYYKNQNKLKRAGIERRWCDHKDYSKRNVKGRGARCLMNNIQKYGFHNHLIKTIFICPTYQANYWEIKFIRQYNTQVPNGMNIMKGGKNSPLAEETKRKISESRKGKYAKENNPMWGKTHSEETIKKIKEALTGKELSQECKINMSNTHRKNKEEGKLPPRRKYNELPKYIYHFKSKNKEGYEIRNHPVLKQKQFTMKSISLEKNLERAIEYLKDVDNSKNFKEKREIQKYTNLPRYIKLVETEKFSGFEVKCHPTKPNKKWTSMKLTMEEKLKLAKDYLDEGSETKRLSVNS